MDKKEKKEKTGTNHKDFHFTDRRSHLRCRVVLSGSNLAISKMILCRGRALCCGAGFIRLMKMLVVPLVFCSLVCGSMAIGDTKKLGTVGVRTLLFYLVTTALAITVALSIGNLINPGTGLDMSAISPMRLRWKRWKQLLCQRRFLELFQTIHWFSFQWKYASNHSVCPDCRRDSCKAGRRTETVGNFFSQFNDIMMEMTMMVMSLAPIGVFCLISRTFANIGFSAFVPLAKYMVGMLIALAIQCFVLYLGLLKVFTGLNPLKFIKTSSRLWHLHSLATSNATIPLSIDTLAKKMGVSKKNFFFHHSSWSNHQYGWNSDYAGRSGCVCCSGIWN